MGSAWTTTSSIIVLLVFTYLRQSSPAELELEDDDVRLESQFFESLAKKFENEIHRLLENSRVFTPNNGRGRQYGILYIPFEPVNLNNPLPEELPNDIDKPWNRLAYIYPINSVLDADVNSSYVITVPHEIPGTGKRHTEAQFIDFRSFQRGMSHIYDRMKIWYKIKQKRYPTVVFMYTYSLPCGSCYGVINRFLGNSRYKDVTLIVGYSSTSWNRRKEGENVVTERIRDLENRNNPILVKVPQLDCDDEVWRDTNKKICQGI